jgi:predicted amidohydrolase
LLLVLASRLGSLAWISLLPIGIATYADTPLLAALAGLVAGALAAVPNHLGRFAPSFFVLLAGTLAVVWGVTFGLAAWIWPDSIPAWGAVILPAAAVAASAIPRLVRMRGYGAPPRWTVNPFLLSQEGWLPVVHLARLGSDLVIPAVLGLSSAIPVVLVVELPPSGVSVVAAAVCAMLVACAITFGVVSYRRAIRRVEESKLIRVAAVSVDEGPAGMGYRDVDLAIRRYRPHVERAIGESARLIVLPEVAVTVTSASRGHWLEAISRWAAQGHARVVSGMLDEELHKNQLLIADETGSIAVTYDKQHPMPGVEDRRRVPMPPGLLARDPFAVSGVICVNLDYGDMVRPSLARVECWPCPPTTGRHSMRLHDRNAVWAVVMAGVPMVRATGHGMSSVYDAAGRVIARQSSFDGPVVLVADAPIYVSGRRLPA